CFSYRSGSTYIF
nr:immunoglobulin light chain junction region [Macaca mulatta]MPO03555.1 immunoglobulin light chain junction region [Macaca mulatta]MPO03611.1 immunoglobulin light chain junction region [Macaca mulatta]MPO03941.1 immunoglobulin light chain junction region [Macaca mulatta]MPO04094.1 immunoglobulin light chain junction region [Macaca mulatta]